jgi:hypothetical protein
VSAADHIARSWACVGYLLAAGNCVADAGSVIKFGVATDRALGLARLRPANVTDADVSGDRVALIDRAARHLADAKTLLLSPSAHRAIHTSRAEIDSQILVAEQALADMSGRGDADNLLHFPTVRS